jgi:hypothetical protein
MDIMLRTNISHQLETMSLIDFSNNNCHIFIKILEIVASHGNLKHLKFETCDIGGGPHTHDQEKWRRVFSQICCNLTSFELIAPEYWDFFLNSTVKYRFDLDLAPLAKAKELKRLNLDNGIYYTAAGTSFYKNLADSFTGLQDLTLFGGGFSDLEMGYFIAKQATTLTSLKLGIWRGETLNVVLSEVSFLSKIFFQNCAVREYFQTLERSF